MRWEAVQAPHEKIALARELVRITALKGWNGRSITEASESALGGGNRWRAYFPRASRDAIWFISEISDASMRGAFDAVPAESMAAVIAERFAQNNDLKPFVRRVMLFDLSHPFQALARMQRTSRVMIDCLVPPRRPARQSAIWTLNLVYTAIVLVWLFDNGRDGKRTRRATSAMMRFLGL